MALGPPDKFGMPHLYPPKVNGWSWYMDNDPQDQDGVDWPDEMDFLGGGVVRMNPNGPTDWGIGKYAKTFSDSIGGCNMDFPATAARGYGYKPDDARDIEYKAMLSFDDIDPDNGFSISCCTGHHSGEGCCQGYAYMGNLRCAENPCPFRYRKEVTHPHYTSLDFFTHPKVNFALNGHGFVGFGFVRYNKPNTTNRVVLEIWFNVHPESNPLDWFMVSQMEDFPGLGFCDAETQGECNGDDDQIGTWSNAQNRMKTNSTSGSVTAKAMSFVEIDPLGSFDNPGGGGGGGGGGTTTRDIYAVINVIFYETAAVGMTDLQDMTATISEEMVESQTDPYVGTNSTSFGNDPGGWYGVSVDGSDPIRDIGDTPCDGSGIFYAYADGLGVDAYWSNSKNRCTVPGRGDSDSGNSTAVTYHGGRVLKNPVIYLIFWGSNWPSPSGGPTQSQITADVRDKLLGSDSIFFSDLNQYSGCGAAVWGDDISLTDTQVDHINNDPSDALIYMWGHNMIPLPSTPATDVIYVFVMDDHPTPWANIAGFHYADSFTVVGTTPGGGGGTPGGGGPGGDPGSPGQVQGTFKFMRDINITRLSSCAGTDTTEGGGGGSGTTGFFYKATDTTLTKQLADDAAAENRTRVVVKALNSSWVGIGKTPKEFRIPLEKTGSPGASPTVAAKIWNSSGTVIFTSSTTFAPNGFTTSFVEKIFDFSANTHALAVGDRIGIEYDGTDNSNCVRFPYQTVEETGTANTCVENYENGWNTSGTTGRRLVCTIFE